MPPHPTNLASEIMSADTFHQGFVKLPGGFVAQVSSILAQFGMDHLGDISLVMLLRILLASLVMS